MTRKEDIKQQIRNLEQELERLNLDPMTIIQDTLEQEGIKVHYIHQESTFGDHDIIVTIPARHDLSTVTPLIFKRCRYSVNAVREVEDGLRKVWFEDLSKSKFRA